MVFIFFTSSFFIYRNVNIEGETLFKSNLGISENNAVRVGILKSIYWALTRDDVSFDPSEICTPTNQIYFDKLRQITKKYEGICKKPYLLYNAEFKDKIAKFERRMADINCSNRDNI